jgi:hypothetical protein
MAKLDRDVMNAALIGYEQELERIKGKIVELQRQLGKNTLAAASAVRPRGARKHHVSAEGRARIAAAQRKRWAAAKRQAAMSARG